MHSDAIVFLFYKTIADWPKFCKRQAGSHNFTPKILITKANQSWCFVTRRLIGLLHPVNFFPRFHLKVDSIFALAFADKMTKKLNCHQETTETQGFLCPKTVCPLHHYLDSHFPRLTSRAATENSSKNSTPPTSTDQQAPVSLLNKKPANQSGRILVSTIRNGSKTTPCFIIKRADSIFGLWW